MPIRRAGAGSRDTYLGCHHTHVRGAPAARPRFQRNVSTDAQPLQLPFHYVIVYNQKPPCNIGGLGESPTGKLLYILIGIVGMIGSPA